MKRNFSANALFLLGAFLLTHFFALSVFAEESKRPNFIIFYTDDQGYGDLACHGHPYLVTPNLDQLYKQSTRFTNFHASPTCAPTRAALMSGRHAFKKREEVGHERHQDTYEKRLGANMGSKGPKRNQKSWGSS